MTSASHNTSINDRLLSPTKRSRLDMHPSTDASPDSAANEPRLTYETASKIVKKLSPDMVDNIFKFISGEEVMRASDIARILSYLGCEEIMSARGVSKKWRDAAMMTVPKSEFVVDSVGSFNAMRVMTTALPNLQQLNIRDVDGGNTYIDGEDPYDNIISNFRRLQSLEIYDAPLNGSYPVLFNFPLLQKFTIYNSNFSELVEWNLDMLSGLPSLKELVVDDGGLSGNVRSMRVLKDTLENVGINNCHITGNFMDLADFPRLKYLNLRDNAVTGDIRDICENHFPALERLNLPWSIRGGVGHQFQHVFEVTSFMHAIHRLLQRNQNLFGYNDDLWDAFRWKLSGQSPDRYDRVSGSPAPPFDLQHIQAGSRFGWSWFHEEFTRHSYSCEINWLDPEPSSESDDYEAYIEALQRVERREDMDFYRGYHEPPTEQQYRRLCEGLQQRD
eukprot:scaffold33581_cov220-Skeletonema_dohrnii-CCMP3373.AAC.2